MENANGEKNYSEIFFTQSFFLGAAERVCIGRFKPNNKDQRDIARDNE